MTPPFFSLNSLFWSELLNRKRKAFHISHVSSSWQNLSVNTKLFDLVTFDLYFENFNIDHIFWTLRGMVFRSSQVCSLSQTHLVLPYFFSFLFSPWCFCIAWIVLLFLSAIWRIYSVHKLYYSDFDNFKGHNPVRHRALMDI